MIDGGAKLELPQGKHSYAKPTGPQNIPYKHAGRNMDDT